MQCLTTSIATVVTCNTVIPIDDTIPQNTEGVEVLTLSITPSSSTSVLEIVFSGAVTNDIINTGSSVALFQDSTADALAARSSSSNQFSYTSTLYLRHIMTSGTTSSTTFKIRIGPTSNNCYVNSDNAGNQLMGGVSSTRLTIKEYL